MTSDGRTSCNSPSVAHSIIIIIIIRVSIICIRVQTIKDRIIRKTILTANIQTVNSLERGGNFSATSNDMKLVHWPLMGGLLHLAHSEEGTGRGRSPARPLLAVPNVTAHPSTTSVPITVLMFNGPLFCVFNLPINGYQLEERVPNQPARQGPDPNRP